MRSIAALLVVHRAKQPATVHLLKSERSRYLHPAPLTEGAEGVLLDTQLEKRWEAALSALKQAEEVYTQQQQQPAAPLALSEELKAAFTAIGQKLPQLWPQQLLTRQNKKALLRCLIDKVVVHRSTRDCVQTRIVWKGGDTTTLEIPISVGSFAELSTASEMEKIIVDLSTAGQSDEEIAQRLTTLGHRSPMRQ